MSSTSVSILVPLTGPAPELPSTLESVEQYLQTTGFEFDVRVLDSRDGDGYGAMIRRGASEAKGSVVVVIDPDLPYPVSAIGDAVALIESESAEIVFATRSGERNRLGLLCSRLPDSRPPFLSRGDDGPGEQVWIQDRVAARQLERECETVVRRDQRIPFGDRNSAHGSQQWLSRAASLSGLFFVRSVELGPDSGQRRSGLQSL